MSNPSTPPLIHVAGLNKSFKVSKRPQGQFAALRGLWAREEVWVHAVQDIGFDILRGELVGYLGPNGAGKSTTLKMLTGILVPTSGEVIVSGRVPWRERKTHVAHIGAVFGQRNTLWWDLPVIESLELLRHIYAVPADRYNQNVALFRQILALDEFLHTPVRSLSLGQRMRANLAAALLHDPEVLFLDEPTIGLDVVAKERIREFILQINRERGTTVILTTHDLADVEKLCDRVMMIDHGRLLFDGKLHELLDRFGGERELAVDFAEDYDAVALTNAAVNARLVSHEGKRAVFRFSRQTASAAQIIGALSAQFQLADLSVREPEIEDTIRRIYEQQLLKDF